MIRDEDELPRAEVGIDPAGGVRHDERADAEPAEHAHSEHHAIGADPFVQVRASAHDGDGDAGNRPEYEHARVPDRRRDRPARDLGVRDLHPRLDLVGEPAEPAAEHDAHPGREVGLLPDPLDGVVDRQTEPSATRLS